MSPNGSTLAPPFQAPLKADNASTEVDITLYDLFDSKASCYLMYT